MTKIIKPLLIAIAIGAIIYGAYRFVQRNNADWRAYEASREAHESDVRMCRLQLGIDKPEFHFRPLMMACVQEVTTGAPAKGEGRSVIFNKAWDKCMPEMDTCARALR